MFNKINMTSTNDKFKSFLQSRLQPTIYAELLIYANVNSISWDSSTFLESISTKKLSVPILILIEQFLENLPKEESIAYVNKLNWCGRSVMFTCRDTALLNIIIKYVLDINHHDIHGNTALLSACSDTNAPLDLNKIILLLDHRANVNAKDIWQMTALMRCCVQSRHCLSEDIKEVLKLLIFCGADVTAKCRYGKSAYDYIYGKASLSDELSQLLQGTIKLNRTKRAM